MKVPESIRKVTRPVNTVVEGRLNKDGSARYIVRERNGINYSEGRSRPKNGGVVGYIIDGQFVPKSPIDPVDPLEVDMMTWAVERLALDLTPDVMEDLRASFSEDECEMIYSMATLRVRNPDLVNSRMKRDYRESLISQIFPGLPMSKNGVSEFLARIGGANLRMRRFFTSRVSRVPAGARLAVDGTLEKDHSNVNNLSSVSRKTKSRGNKDVSIIFAYDVDKMEPVCSSMYPGNLIDSKAYSDFIEENDLKDALLVGDKAFTLNAARKQFTGDRNLHYLFPIRRNSAVIDEYGLHGFNGVLKTYQGVTYCVFHDVNKGIYYYSFRDAERAAEEEMEYLDQIRRGKKGTDQTRLESGRENWGTITYQSDLELVPERVYEIYRQRWMIEEMFRMYKHIEEFDDTRVHSDQSVQAEHFVNFISTLITSRFMRAFLEKGLLEKNTYGDVITTLRRSLKFRNEDGEWVFRAQTDKEKEILRSLDLMPKLVKRGPGRPRKNP